MAIPRLGLVMTRGACLGRTASRHSVMNSSVVLDGRSLTIADVEAVARSGRGVSLAGDARDRMLRAHHHVDRIVRDREVVYGVTTGFGKLSEVAIPPERLAELQVNLVRSHASGVGQILTREATRAMMLLRANVLAKGYSGARPQLPELLVDMLNAGLWPPIPEQGSVGASGDLAPLAHLGAGDDRRGRAVRRDGTWRRGRHVAPPRSHAGRARPQGGNHAHQRHTSAHGDRRARDVRTRDASGSQRTLPVQCRSRRC